MTTLHPVVAVPRVTERLGRLGLSGRQAEVALLLAEGMTEEAAADRLCLSPHTVHDHAKHIYRLLGVHSRVELAGRIFRILAETP